MTLQYSKPFYRRKAIPIIKSYSDASEFLGSRQSKRLHGRSTKLVRLSPDVIAVQYHWTDIVTFCEDGHIGLSTGGHETVTTKRKINEYTPDNFGVFQKNWAWYYVLNGQTHAFPYSGIFSFETKES